MAKEVVVSKMIKEITKEVLKVFQKYYDQLGHPSYERSFIMINKELISRKEMRKIYRKYLEECEICAKLKKKRKNKEKNLSRHKKLSLEAMNELQMDLLGLVKGSMNDYQHVLELIDRATRYLFLINLRTKSTEEIYRKLTERVFGVFGISRIFTSDRAKSFESLLYKGTLINFGCSHHHESQALIKRTFRTIERSFKAMALQMNESLWDNLTTMVCLNNNISYHTVLKKKPAKLFLVYIPRLPFAAKGKELKKYNYSLERQNEIDKARRVSYEILKALQETPADREEGLKVGMTVKMKEAARNQIKFEPSQAYVITEKKSLYVYLKVEGAKRRPIKRHVKNLIIID